MQRRSTPAGAHGTPRPQDDVRQVRRQLAVVVAVVLLLGATLPALAQAAPLTTRFGPIADATVDAAQPEANLGRRPWLMVDGAPETRALLRFRVRTIAGPVMSARLVLHTVGPLKAPLEVRLVASHRWRERGVTAATAPTIGRRLALATRASSCGPAGRCTVSLNVTRLLRHRGNGTYDFAVGVAHAWQSQRLVSREGGRNAPRLIVRSRPLARRAPVAVAPTGPRAVAGIWTTPAEVAALPMSGKAWTALKSAADGDLGKADIADQDSDTDVNTLAAALVFARTGQPSYRAKVASAVAAAIGTEQGGRTLALGRNLASYVIAADLVSLGQLDPDLDARFRSWLSAVRTENLDGLTLIETHEKRPNNWGTMAGASRTAIDAYIGDTADLDRAYRVFAGWAGDRSAYTGFDFGDMSWQVDPTNPVGILPAGAVKQGLSIDGALPDDMRRGCSFAVEPCHTNYVWEALQGAIVQAMILSRRGYDTWNLQNRAILRAVQFVDRLERQFGGWWAATDDEWQPWVINRVYGTAFRTVVAGGPGKVMGWTDWTLGS